MPDEVVRYTIELDPSKAEATIKRIAQALKAAVDDAFAGVSSPIGQRPQSQVANGGSQLAAGGAGGGGGGGGASSTSHVNTQNNYTQNNYYNTFSSSNNQAAFIDFGGGGGSNGSSGSAGGGGGRRGSSFGDIFQSLSRLAGGAFSLAAGNFSLSVARGFTSILASLFKTPKLAESGQTSTTSPALAGSMFPVRVERMNVLANLVNLVALGSDGNLATSGQKLLTDGGSGAIGAGGGGSGAAGAGGSARAGGFAFGAGLLALGAAVGLVVVAMGACAVAVNSAAQNLANYNQELFVATTRLEMIGEGAKFFEAARLGPLLAKFQDSMGGLTAAIAILYSDVMDKLIPVGTLAVILLTKFVLDLDVAVHAISVATDLLLSKFVSNFSWIIDKLTFKGASSAIQGMIGANLNNDGKELIKSLQNLNKSTDDLVKEMQAAGNISVGFIKNLFSAIQLPGVVAGGFHGTGFNAVPNANFLQLDKAPDYSALKFAGGDSAAKMVMAEAHQRGITSGTMPRASPAAVTMKTADTINIEAATDDRLFQEFMDLKQETMSMMSMFNDARLTRVRMARMMY